MIKWTCSGMNTKAQSCEIQFDASLFNRFGKPDARPVRAEKAKAVITGERQLVGMPGIVIRSAAVRSIAHVTGAEPICVGCSAWPQFRL